MGLECQIVLDNATLAFYPGETVSGRIVIINDKERNVKGLKLKFSGKCVVMFSELERRRPRRNRPEQNCEVHYKSEEIYLDYLLNVFGNDGSQQLIPPGRFEYPFQYLLPLSLPASYEGLHGRITYKVEAELPRSWAVDCKAFTVFRILGYVDLNIDSEAQQEGLVRQRQSLGCCCCKSGAASFVLKLQKRGMAVGEFVPFIADISNKSNKTLGAKISLIQEVKYTAQGKHRKVINSICSVDGPSIAAGEDDIWRGNILQVPPVVPSRLGSGCGLIDVSYMILMEVTGTGIFNTLKGKTPVVIGTLPFRNSSQIDHTIYEPPPPYQAVATSTITQAAPSAPSYDESQEAAGFPKPTPPYTSPPKFLG